jgi:hypothetical protein
VFAALVLPFLLHTLLLGGLAPRDLRTAHCRGRRISYFAVERPRAGYRFISFVFPRPHIPWGWMTLSRELNKINKYDIPVRRDSKQAPPVHNFIISPQKIATPASFHPTTFRTSHTIFLVAIDYPLQLKLAVALALISREMRQQTKEFSRFLLHAPPFLAGWGNTSRPLLVTSQLACHVTRVSIIPDCFY